MEMGMGLRQEMIQRCRVCDRSIEDHEPDCPQGQLQELMKSICLGSAGCPVCRNGIVRRNSGDFFECERCHAQMTTGIAYSEADAKSYFLDFPVGDLVIVLLMEDKGPGRFPQDEFIELLKRQIESRLEK